MSQYLFDNSLKQILQKLAEFGLDDTLTPTSDEQPNMRAFEDEYTSSNPNITNVFIGDSYIISLDRNHSAIFLYPLNYFNTSEYGCPPEYAELQIHVDGSDELRITKNSVGFPNENYQRSFSTEEEKFQISCTEDGFFIQFMDILFTELNKDYSEELRDIFECSDIIISKEDE